MTDRQELGRYGEEVAVAHLQAAGLEVLDRNWRCREGEIDVVARAGAVLVFVEVKTRSGSGFGEPAEAVTLTKARRLRVLACRWLAERRPPGATDLRFDVVSVLRRRGHAPQVVHLQAAF
ncbi:MAG: YraN family protein [Actinomycetota bacterium]|nr:YraN family protein [Actinomycetota bacterium]